MFVQVPWLHVVMYHKFAQLLHKVTENACWMEPSVLVTCHGRSSGSRPCRDLRHSEGRPSGSPDWSTAGKLSTGRPSERAEDSKTSHCFCFTCLCKVATVLGAVFCNFNINCASNTVSRPTVIRRLLRRWMTRRVDCWTPQTVKKSAYFRLLYLSGVLKKGRLSSDDGCCRASGLAQCLRASVGKTWFKNLLSCLRYVFKESRN